MSTTKPGSTLIHSLVAMSGQTQVVTVPRAFVAFTGSIDRALVLNQLLFWSAAKNGEWFYKSDADLCAETCLGRKQLRAATAWLCDENDMFETDIRRAEGAPTKHYRLANFEAHWSQWISEGMPQRKRERKFQSAQSDDHCAKRHSGKCQLAQSKMPIGTNMNREDLREDLREDVGDFVAAATPPTASAFALPDSTDDSRTVAVERELLANSCPAPQPPISAAPPSPKRTERHSQPRDNASLGTGLRQSSFADDAPAEKPQRRRSKAKALSAAAQIYKDIACLTPTKAQRFLLDDVSDLDLWRESVAYWIAQGWKPTSIGGMLDRYRKALEAKEKASSAKDAAEKELAAQRSRARPLTAEERQRNLEILNAARGQWKSAD